MTQFQIVALPIIFCLLCLTLTIRFTVFSGLKARRMRWRTLIRIRPGQGFATGLEMVLRWGRWPVVAPFTGYGRDTRPSISPARRLVTPTTEMAVRLGRGPYFRRLYINPKFQTLILAPPRKYKTGHLGDRLILHPGPAIAHEVRTTLFEGTGGYRARLGRVEVFNPDQLGGVPSTFGWAMTQGCEDPAEALYRAMDLVGSVADTGEMRWWVEKAQTALAAGLHSAGAVDFQAFGGLGRLAAGMHAAGRVGADMTSVFAWAYGDRTLINQAREIRGVSQMLIGALSELERGGKTADSVKVTMSKALAWMAVPRLRDAVTGPGARPFNVPAWINERGTIYMISPGGEQSAAAPLYRCFTSYVQREAKKYASRLSGRLLDPGLLFALDEIDKCPVDLPSWLADAAGSGIQVVAVAHSLGQLEEKYGKPGLDTIISTTGVKIMFGGNHHARALQDTSVLCGTLPGGEARGLNPIVPVEYIRTLPKKRAFVLYDAWSPMVVTVRPYWAGLRRIFARRPPQLAAPAQATANGHRTVEPDTLEIPAWINPTADDSTANA